MDLKVYLFEFRYRDSNRLESSGRKGLFTLNENTPEIEVAVRYSD